jgi:hypothetical protein
LCYTVYPCVPAGVPMPFSTCAMYYIDPGGYTWPAPPHCLYSLALPFSTCDSCVGDDDNKERYYVQNDSCNS